MKHAHRFISLAATMAFILTALAGCLNSDDGKGQSLGIQPHSFESVYDFGTYSAIIKFGEVIESNLSSGLRTDLYELSFVNVNHPELKSLYYLSNDFEVQKVVSHCPFGYKYEYCNEYININYRPSNILAPLGIAWILKYDNGLIKIEGGENGKIGMAINASITGNKSNITLKVGGPHASDESTYLYQNGKLIPTSEKGHPINYWRSSNLSQIGDLPSGIQAVRGDEVPFGNYGQPLDGSWQTSWHDFANIIDGYLSTNQASESCIMKIKLDLLERSYEPNGSTLPTSIAEDRAYVWVINEESMQIEKYKVQVEHDYFGRKIEHVELTEVEATSLKCGQLEDIQGVAMTPQIAVQKAKNLLKDMVEVENVEWRFSFDDSFELSAHQQEFRVYGRPRFVEELNETVILYAQYMATFDASTGEFITLLGSNADLSKY